MELKRIGDLQIEADDRYHRSFIRIQRAGWAAITLLLLAAVAGIIGPGLLGTSTVASPDNLLKAEYSMTSNSHRDTWIWITAESPGSGPITIWISREYVESFHIEEIVPEPERVYATGDRVFYEFLPAPGETMLKISLLAEPSSIGPISGTVGAGGQLVKIKQFIWP